MSYKLIDICPKCGGEGLRAEATIDMLVYYNKAYGTFNYEEDGNEPMASGFYCFECGETFSLEQVEEQAKRL
jgi:hypothetical protein